MDSWEAFFRDKSRRRFKSWDRQALLTWALTMFGTFILATGLIAAVTALTH